MKKFLFVLPSLDTGGAEHYALRLLRYLSGKYHFTIIVPDSAHAGDMHYLFKEAGAEIIFKKQGNMNVSTIFFWGKIFKNKHFDVLCNLNGDFSGLSICFASLFKVPKRIAFYRRSTYAFKSSKLKMLCVRFLNRVVWLFASDILSNSSLAFRNFFPYRDQDDCRFKVIPNGADIDLFQKSQKEKSLLREEAGILQDAVVIGHVGRVDPAKNHETIFKIAKNLKSRCASIVWVYCGKGTDSEEFKENLKKHGLMENSVLLGVQKDIARVYSLMDIFIFPSLTEGQPNALIEAMLSDIPVLASDIEPIQEAVPEYFKKYLISSKSDAEFAETILKMIHVPEERNKYRLAQFAQSHFDARKRFSQIELILNANNNGILEYEYPAK